MRCAWQAYLNLLPIWMRQNVDRQGREILQELRLRLNSPPELITTKGRQYLERPVSADDLKFCVNIASRYSPWIATTAANGYITAPGGHRIGLCGTAVTANGVMSGVHTLTSLCLRVSRDFPGIAKSAAKYDGSILIIGKPGSGKTTLLRDLIRQKSNTGKETIAVVDERYEIFPYCQDQFCFPVGMCTDILSGCRKNHGVDSVLRSMGPDTIAMDEITADEDCQALLHAGWCGVNLLATAHAGSKQDLFRRPLYRPIVENALFDTVIVLRPDKSWYAERMNI